MNETRDLTLDTATDRNAELAGRILASDGTTFRVPEIVRLLADSLIDQIAINRVLIEEARRAQQERRGRD